MSDFKTVCESFSNLDPYKRVNYVNGLVLGADEFVQEQLYHLEKRRLHNRLLHGYGTVCGLRVSPSEAGEEPQVTVEPGIAVDPQGHEIRVTEAHCANLNDWLENHQTEIGTSQSLSLYLTLGYRECRTDEVPIPGGPCKTLDDSSVASRIQDAFDFSFRLEAPDQTENDNVVALVDLLSAIGISHAAGGLSTADIEALVRGLIETGEPPRPEDLQSPHMHPDDVDELMCAAMRVWVTEGRPRLLADGKSCIAGLPDEACVLLTELQINLDNDFHVAGEATVIEDNRPYLLHTRLLQEWLLCARGGRTNEDPPRSFATLSLINPNTIRAWLHYPDRLNLHPFSNEAVSIEVEPAPDGATTVNRVSKVPSEVNLFDLELNKPLRDGDRVTVTFDTQRIMQQSDSRDSPWTPLSQGMAALDFPYLDNQDSALRAYLTVVEPAVPELALGDLSDVEVGSPPADGEVLTWSGSDWRPGNTSIDAIAAGRDLSGNYPNPTVSRLQNRLVSADEPNNGDVLTWSVSEWRPRAADFVRVPAKTLPYSIVAAGMFDDEGQPIGLVFNGLTAEPVSKFNYRLSFTDYKQPPRLNSIQPREGTGYIVKGTVVSQEVGSFQFVEFQEGGIMVTARAARTAGIGERIRRVEVRAGFMVEISAY